MLRLLALLVSASPPIRLSALQCPDGSPPPCRAAEGRGLVVGDSVVAVLPFRVVGPQLTLWREGLVDLLAMQLDGAGGLHAVAPQRVIAGVQRLARSPDLLDPATARRVARGLGAATYITGSVVETGAGRVRLLIESHDVRTGRKRLDASFSLDGREHDLASLADSATLALLARLTRIPIPVAGTTRRPTRSVAALRAFLLGEQAFRAGRWTEADGRYLEALELDSTFALPLYRRFQLRYRGQVTAPPSESELVAQAVALAEWLPERERRLLFAVRRGSDYLDSTDLAERSEFTRRYPNDPEGWVWLAEWYYHAGGVYEQPLERVLEAGHRALALDSTLWTAYHHPVEVAARLGDSATARALLDRYLPLVAPDDRVARAQALAYRLRFSDPTAARRSIASLAAEPDPVLVRLYNEVLRFDARVSALGVAEAVAALEVRVARSAEARRTAQAALAQLQVAQGRIAAAETTLTRLLEDDPRHLDGGAAAAVAIVAGLARPTAGYAAGVAALRAIAADALTGGAPEPTQLLAATLLSRVDLALGDTAAALTRSRDLRSLWGPSEVVRALVRLDSAAVHARAALGRGDTAAAVGLLRFVNRAVVGRNAPLAPWQGPDHYLLAELHARRGETALAYRLLTQPDAMPGARGGFLGFELLLSAELAEQAGDTAAARAAHRDVTELWQGGDPIVRPYVERARAALTTLGER